MIISVKTVNDFVALAHRPENQNATIFHSFREINSSPVIPAPKSTEVEFQYLLCGPNYSVTFCGYEKEETYRSIPEMLAKGNIVYTTVAALRIKDYVTKLSI